VNYFGRTQPPDVLQGNLGGTLELRKRVIAGQVIATQFDLFVRVLAGSVPRQQINLVVLVDGSLSEEGRKRAKATLEALGQGLTGGDQVVLVRPDAGYTQVPIKVAANAATELQALAADLEAGPSSVGERLPVALDIASKFPHGAWNRVVVIGDGEESASEVDFAAVETAAKSNGVFTSAFGVSPSLAGDALLQRLAQWGSGRYVYVDSAAEATAWAPRVTEVFGVARDNVRVRVDLPDYMYSISPSASGGTGAVARDKYLAPGEQWHLVFHLASCSEGAVLDPNTKYMPLTVSVESTLADGKTAASDFSVGSYPVEKLLFKSASAPGLDGMVAIEAFANALLYPEKQRFADATSALSGTAATLPVGATLLGLLKKHPSYPAN
jgi:hypothetical protein